MLIAKIVNGRKIVNAALHADNVLFIVTLQCSAYGACVHSISSCFSLFKDMLGSESSRHIFDCRKGVLIREVESIVLLFDREDVRHFR